MSKNWLVTGVHLYTLIRSPLQVFYRILLKLKSPSCTRLYRSASSSILMWAQEEEEKKQLKYACLHLLQEFTSISHFSDFSRIKKKKTIWTFWKSACSLLCDLTIFCPLLLPPQRIPLSDMTRADINSLLAELGFYKKAQAEDEVPEEFRFSPAKDSPFKEHHTRAPTNSHVREEPQPEKESPHKDL